MRNALAPLGVIARQKGLSFGHRLATGTPTHLVGDPERLRQVLLNLASNAVKFTEKGSIGFDNDEEDSPAGY